MADQQTINLKELSDLDLMAMQQSYRDQYTQVTRAINTIDLEIRDRLHQRQKDLVAKQNQIDLPMQAPPYKGE